MLFPFLQNVEGQINALAAFAVLFIVRQVLAPREQRHMCICNLQIVDIYQNIRPRQHTGDIGNNAL